MQTPFRQSPWGELMPHPITSLIIWLLFPAFAQAGTLVSAAGARTAPRPNIIIILADDMGPGDVSSNYPEGKIQTPHIDRLAAEGMRFANAHSPSSVCTPTRYGLLTGRYCWRTRLKWRVLLPDSNEPLIEPERTTLPELLRDHGYATKMVGKWHLGMTYDNWSDPIQGGPLDHGFEDYYGVDLSANLPPYALIRDRHFIDEPTEQYTGWWPVSMSNGPMAPDFDIYQLMPMLTREAVQYIENREGRQEPFFLYFPMTAPHFPIAPAEQFQGAAEIASDYADFVKQVDHDVGEVLAALDRTGQADNTLIVFTADNGCAPQAGFDTLMSQGHNPSAGLRGAKLLLWEGGHRVPFVVRWPGKVRADGANDSLICLTDFLRTTATLLNVELPESEGVDSYDMLPHLLETEPTGPVRESVVHHNLSGRFGIQEGRWKLICEKGEGNRYPNADAYPQQSYDTFQLYDLQEDTREFQNIYTQHPGIVEALKTRLTEIVDNGRETPGPPQQNYNNDNRFRGVNWVD